MEFATEFLTTAKSYHADAVKKEKLRVQNGRATVGKAAAKAVGMGLGAGLGMVTGVISSMGAAKAGAALFTKGWEKYEEKRIHKMTLKVEGTMGMNVSSKEAIRNFKVN